MMRVISGLAKGRRLQRVPGDTTRPITDRVRENLFNILDNYNMIANANWYDMFGGTGAVGIEALSRGANSVVFTDKIGRAVTTIQNNINAVGLAESNHKILNMDAFGYLRSRGWQTPFDLIYIAPPQYKNLWLDGIKLVDELAGECLQAPHGMAVVQIHPKEFDKTYSPVNLEKFDERKYGSTLLVFYDLGKS